MDGILIDLEIKMYFPLIKIFHQITPKLNYFKFYKFKVSK